MNDALLRLALIVIALITLVTGLSQWVAGDFVLGMVTTSTEPAAVHLFRTVGMFMFITGAMFLQSLLKRSNESAIPLWIAVQKFSAAALVTLAWHQGLFVTMALFVAGFDFLTGLLAFIFWRRLPQ